MVNLGASSCALFESHCTSWRSKRLGSDSAPRSARRERARQTRNNKRRLREPWTKDDVKILKTLAKENTPTGVMSIKLQRPPSAIRSKAQREGISLSPANRSPYTRRKTKTTKARR